MQTQKKFIIEIEIEIKFDLDEISENDMKDGIRENLFEHLRETLESPTDPKAELVDFNVFVK